MFAAMMLLSLILALNAHALTFELVKPCSNEVALKKDYPAKAQSVGKTTIEILEQEKIPFIGEERGINSILNSPVDHDAMEITKEEVKAFGWCYEVDGKLIDKLPDEVQLQGNEHVRWFFGFARLRKNDWLSYCEPSALAKPGKVCP